MDDLTREVSQLREAFRTEIAAVRAEHQRELMAVREQYTLRGEVLATLSERLRTAVEQLEALARTIRGNGQPGLVTRMATAESEQARTNARLRELEMDGREETGETRKGRWLVRANVLPALITAGVILAAEILKAVLQ